MTANEPCSNLPTATVDVPRTLVLPTAGDVEGVIVGAVVSRLREWLSAARHGMCGRLDDLPTTTMARVAAALYPEFAAGGEGEGNSDRHGNEAVRANVRLLMQGERKEPEPWECSWTEAVRLRNPDENGERRPPFLLLVPPGTELLGSLDADTFRTIPCEDIVRGALTARLSALPSSLAPIVELIRRREIVREVSDVHRLRYLLALEHNGYSHEAAGLALCLLGLWPHRDWLVSGDQREYWYTRNRDIMARLRNGTTSLLDRIYALKLTAPEQARHLYELLARESKLDRAAEKVAIEPSLEDLDFGRWEFASRPDTVVITVEQPDLPLQENGFPVLRVREQPQLSLTWAVTPAPTQVPDLTHYLVELVSSEEGAEVAYTSGP